MKNGSTIWCAFTKQGGIPRSELPSPHVLGGPLHYHAGPLSYCISYFAALVCHTDIFAKGVKELPHDASAVFYRCMSLLPADKLAVMLGVGVSTRELVS